MTKALLKDLLREIWRSKSRFLAIMAIVAIGSGFFAGVKSSCPDMKMTAKAYYEDYNLADFHVMSNYGLDDEDIKAIRKAVNVRGITGGYSVDAMVKSSDDNIVLKVISFDISNPDTVDNINRPLLVDGRLPRSSGECVVVESKLASTDLEIGTKLQLYLEKDDLSESLNTTEFKVVGTINLPSYVGFQYGNTTIGDGEIDSYILVPEEDFAYEVYTDIYFTLDETEGLDPFEQEYTDIIEKNAELLDENKELSYGRYDAIVAEAEEALDEARKELADGEAEANKQLEDAKKELDDAKATLDESRQKLDDGWDEYYDGVASLNTEIADAKRQLNEGRITLKNAEVQYNNGLAEYNSGYQEFLNQEAEALETLREYETQLAELEPQVQAGRDQINQAYAMIDSFDEAISKYTVLTVKEEEIPADELALMDTIDSMISEMLPDIPNMPDLSELENLPIPLTVKGLFVVYATTENIEEKQLCSLALNIIASEARSKVVENEVSVLKGEMAVMQLKSGIDEGYSQLDDAREELDDAKKELDNAKKEIDDGYAEIEANEALIEQNEEQGKKLLDASLEELKEGEKQYAEGLVQYEDGFAEYEKSSKEADDELNDAREKIKDAERDLKNLSQPEWYVFDRNNNPGYSTYKEDAEKVDAIAAVFPFFFVLVAALVCSTTMTRMVEEQRTQMGTLKALGYSNKSIALKYLLYAISASVVGSVIGLCVGFKLFPWVIINAYKIMYSMPEPMLPFRWDYAGWCTLVGILCTGLSAYFVCRRELKTVPAQLMRPKAPKQGKKILLERVGFVWKRLSFSRKVTARNIFRYKSRTLMTTIGVAGCCALILTGFGLNYAITSIVDRQFDDIFIYDITVAVGENCDIDSVKEYVDDKEEVADSMALMSKTVDVNKSDGVLSVSLIVPKDVSNIGDFITLRTMDDKTPLELNNEGVIINQKLAKILGIEAGDSMTILNSNGSSTTVKVSGVTENYAMNYIYMTPELYDELYYDTPDYNMIYANISGEADTETLSRELLDNEDVLGVAYSSDIMGRFIDTIGSLKSIVIVIIVSAGLLAFIVMYNLMNINVNERKRELATIKVLGFFDREVSAYIYRENNVAVFIGIVLGLIGGIFLERFVVNVAEVDAVMFISDMAWWCFVISAVITALFAVIVTIVVHFTLKKIDMVESLKAIE